MSEQPTSVATSRRTELGSPPRPARGLGGPVLGATDASSEAHAALLVAAEVARLTDAQLDIVYVWREPQQAEWYAETLPAPVHTAFLREARGVLNHEVAHLRRSGTKVVRSYLRYGDPTPEILDLAGSCGASLVVIGGRTHGALHRLLWGSVVEDLAQNSQVPLLVVRNPESNWPPRSLAVVSPRAPSSADQLSLSLLIADRYGLRVIAAGETAGESSLLTNRALRTRLLKLAAGGALVEVPCPPRGFRHRLASGSPALRVLRRSPNSILVAPPPTSLR